MEKSILPEEREPWRAHISGFGTVVDLSGCSFALGKNHVCDALLCKFRCPKHLEPDKEMKIGLHLCPRNNEYEAKSQHERIVAGI